MCCPQRAWIARPRASPRARESPAPILAASATWNVLYQNTFAMQGFAAFDGDHNVEFSKLSKMSYIFMAVNLAALLISVPIWQMMGLIG